MRKICNKLIIHTLEIHGKNTVLQMYTYLFVDVGFSFVTPLFSFCFNFPPLAFSFVIFHVMHGHLTERL